MIDEPIKNRYWNHLKWNWNSIQIDHFYEIEPFYKKKNITSMIDLMMRFHLAKYLTY